MGHAARPILLVEDDADMVAAKRLLLEDEGYAAVSAPDVPRAIESIKRDMPGLVLLDWSLDDGSGEEVLQAAKREPSTASTPFVVITGASGLPHGPGDTAQAVLQKPFDVGELLRVVQLYYRP